MITHKLNRFSQAHKLRRDDEETMDRKNINRPEACQQCMDLSGPAIARGAWDFGCPALLRRPRPPLPPLAMHPSWRHILARKVQARRSQGAGRYSLLMTSWHRALSTHFCRHLCWRSSNVKIQRLRSSFPLPKRRLVTLRCLAWRNLYASTASFLGAVRRF